MRKTLLVAALVAPTLVRAQTTTAPPPALSANGAFFALSVPDLEASVRWYSDKLGLKVTMRPPKQNQSAVAVLPARNGQRANVIVKDNTGNLIQFFGRAPPR